MKTKKILFATALVASFASCTNDDIVEVQQGVANVNRPTVENVKLNFVGDNAESRLLYNGNYAWQASDKIGAILMSDPRRGNDFEDVYGGKEDEWREKYEFVNFISTSYPFSYNTETKVWGNDAKMLEGDYFFAHPWTDYDGARYLMHSLKHQEQTGVASSTVAKSFADNQFLIGYSQIKAGTEAVDALNDVAMTPVLGGIQFRIINDGTKTYHINKIVVEGEDIITELTFDPSANYTAASEFNYANYVGDKTSELYTAGEEYAYTADKKYDRSVDIRRYVVEHPENTANVAQLNVRGTKAERAIAKGKTGYAVVMLNEDAEVATGELKVTIFTDEGVIQGVDLTAAPNLEYEYNEFVLVDKQIKSIGYNVTNTVSIKFKDEAVETIMSANVVDNEDLYHLIEWNAASDIKVTPVATLTGKDVELTKEIFDLLKSNENVTLTIDGTESLTLAEGLPVDVLDYKGLVINTPIIVATEIELTEDTPVFADMTITEEGVVTIEEIGAGVPAKIVNEGNINIGSEAIVVFTELTNNEDGIVTIAAEADVKGDGYIANDGKIYNNGYLQYVANSEDAEIVLGKDAILKDVTNAGEVTTAEGSFVHGSNTGLINFVTGATLDVTGAGKVSAEAPATVTKNMYEDTGINTLTLKAGQTTTIADGETGGIKYIIAAEGATLKVADEKSLSLSELTAGAKLTIMGTVVTDEMEIAKDVKVYNYGSLDVNTTWTNKGIVYNNGSVDLPVGTEATAGMFKYTQPTFDQAVQPAEQTALEAVVEYYWKSAFANLSSWFNSSNLSNNPYDLDVMANTLNYWVSTGEPKTAVLMSSGNWNLTSPGVSEIKAKLEENYTAFVAAVDKYLFTAENITADANPVLTSYIDAKTGALVSNNLVENNATLFNSSDAAMRDLLGKLLTTPSNKEGYIANMKIYKNISTATIKTALEKTANATTNLSGKYMYIWTDCNLDKAVAIWKKYDGVKVTGYATDDYTKAIEAAVTNTHFVNWASAVMKQTEYATIKTELAACGVALDTYVSFSNYSAEQFKACAE